MKARKYVQGRVKDIENDNRAVHGYRERPKYRAKSLDGKFVTHVGKVVNLGPRERDE